MLDSNSVSKKSNFLIDRMYINLVILNSAVDKFAWKLG